MAPGFLLPAALLALIVTAALVWPLLRRKRQLAARRDYDLAIYRDQLAEIERDQQRGVLSEAEAAASRLEVQRRLLAADRAGDGAAEAPRAERREWFTPLALGLLVPGLALGLYLMLGRPDLPSIDFAEQQAVQADMAGLAEQLRARLAEQPDNASGWELLGRTYLQLGRPGEAAEAFRTALAKGGEPGRIYGSLGEALVAGDQGMVGAEARAAFAQALEANPSDPRARYFAGLALVQDGRAREGLEIWQALAAASPPDSPWLPTLERAIATVSAELGEPSSAAGSTASPGPRSGPTREQVEAAGEMSQEERAAFIRSMVERLSERLEQEPGDIDGWLRLARARQVLGEREAAAAALRSALAQLAERPADDPQRRAVEQALQDLEAQGG